MHTSLLRILVFEKFRYSVDENFFDSLVPEISYDKKGVTSFSDDSFSLSTEITKNFKIYLRSLSNKIIL